MIETIKAEADRRGISRICHFSPSRNLIHIASGSVGILATSRLNADERSLYTATDLQRLDGKTEYISCSVQYPNGWYFDKARIKDQIFKDWVVLLISPYYLWQEGTLFCPRNAAASSGGEIKEGTDAFISLFSSHVVGAYGKTRSRSRLHPDCYPTDDQAEVLIPDRIRLEDIIGIAVRDVSQAKAEAAALRLVGVSPDRFKFVVAPLFFDKHKLSQTIRSGKLPTCSTWSAE